MAGGTVTGEHIVGSAFVGGFAVSHRTTYGDFVRNLGGVLEVFAEMDAGILVLMLLNGPRYSGSVGLGVPGFLVSHPPGR